MKVLKKETQTVEGAENESMIIKVKEEILDAKTPIYASMNGIEIKTWNMVDYSYPFWARAISETQVKLTGLSESILALMDHGSKINIISKKVFNKSRWPIDTNHGWVLRATNDFQGDLYGACLGVKIQIGDVVVDQNLFVQNVGTYSVILGQPYITTSRMETKILDDESHYAHIHSPDGKKSVQFLIMRPNNERNRDQLRDSPDIS
jgi:hypothetical protein